MVDTPEGYLIYKRPETLEGLQTLIETFDSKWFGHSEIQGTADFVYELTGLTNLRHLKEVAK